MSIGWRRAVAEGARQVPDVQVELLTVAETLPGGRAGQDGRHRCEESLLRTFPSLMRTIWGMRMRSSSGIGTRFGSATAQMRTLLDATGQLWQTGALVGQSRQRLYFTGTQHGGQETPLTKLSQLLFPSRAGDCGRALRGAGTGQHEGNHRRIALWASTVTRHTGSAMPSAHELAIARYQARTPRDRGEAGQKIRGFSNEYGSKQ